MDQYDAWRLSLPAGNFFVVIEDSGTPGGMPPEFFREVWPPRTTPSSAPPAQMIRLLFERIALDRREAAVAVPTRLNDVAPFPSGDPALVGVHEHVDPCSCDEQGASEVDVAAVLGADDQPQLLDAGVHVFVDDAVGVEIIQLTCEPGLHLRWRASDQCKAAWCEHLWAGESVDCDAGEADLDVEIGVHAVSCEFKVAGTPSMAQFAVVRAAHGIHHFVVRHPEAQWTDLLKGRKRPLLAIRVVLRGPLQHPKVQFFKPFFVGACVGNESVEAYEASEGPRAWGQLSRGSSVVLDGAGPEGDDVGVWLSKLVA